PRCASALELSPCRSSLPKASKAVNSGFVRYSSSARAAADSRMASRSSGAIFRNSAAVHRRPDVFGFTPLISFPPEKCFRGYPTQVCAPDQRPLTKALSKRRYLENVVSPLRHVQVKPARRQFVAASLVLGGTEQVAQQELFAAQLGERQGDVTLALGGAVVDRDQQPLAVRALPGERQEAVPGRVVLPGGAGVQQLPAALAHLRPLQHLQQLLVIRLQGRIDRLVGAAAEVDRQLD